MCMLSSHSPTPSLSLRQPQTHSLSVQICLSGRFLEMDSHTLCLLVPGFFLLAWCFQGASCYCLNWSLFPGCFYQLECWFQEGFLSIWLPAGWSPAWLTVVDAQETQLVFPPVTRPWYNRDVLVRFGQGSGKRDSCVAKRQAPYICLTYICLRMSNMTKPLRLIYFFLTPWKKKRKTTFILLISDHSEWFSMWFRWYF